MPEHAERDAGLYDRAYAAVDAGQLQDAVDLFGQLARAEPDNPAFQYMLGLAHKYRFEWDRSLACNLRALALFKQSDEATLWNAAIAATGLGDWAQARRIWQEVGIKIAAGTGPILADFGSACVRLNAWDEGETMWALRLDPCRARIENVPYPESGFRFGDVVLHDGAATGGRQSRGRTYPVFNVFQRLERSAFDTFEVELTCPGPGDLEALLSLQRPGIGLVEDWTSSVQALCRQCSLGLPHGVHVEEDLAWNPERSVGIAAQARAAVDRLLRDWTGAGDGRRIETVTLSRHEPQPPTEGSAWWRGADEDEDEDENKDDDGKA